jgi:hypothetical protein
MKKFIERFSGLVKGTITGFDRIVFKGFVLPLMATRGANFGKEMSERQLSAKISRHLRLIRVHGLIRKLPKQNRYHLTLKGVKLTYILNAFLAASTEQLIKMAA